MKIQVFPPSEDWIVDRMAAEWRAGNSDISNDDPSDPTAIWSNTDIMWLLADWCWKRCVDGCAPKIKKHMKFVTTVHHIVPEKWDDATKRDFDERDDITDLYHVFNDRALQQVKQLTSKSVIMVPYWANQAFWYRQMTSAERITNRRHLDITQDDYVIMSAQRDTEGHDLVSPKLEKGPDLLADALIELNKRRGGDVVALLGGWRRQYLIKRLSDAGVRYKYIERPQLNIVRDMYQMADVYYVTARHEGGPQALIECGLMGLPCASTPVGIAEQVLPTEAINVNVLEAIPTVPNVEHMKLPHGFDGYRKMFAELLQNA